MEENTLPAHANRDHAELGGSGASIWVNCQGYVFHKREVPEKPPGQAALDGTEAHELMETVLEDFLEHKLTGSDPNKRLASLNPSSPELLEFANTFTKHVWEDVLHEELTGKAYGIESKFSLSDNLHMFGTIDFWAIYINEKGQRVACIVDLKTGFIEVSAEKNAQLAYYALALRNELRKRGKDIDLVRGAIVQVRSKRVYEESNITTKQLDAWEKRFMKAAEQVYIKKKPKYKVGKWCRYCPAQAVCPKYIKEMEKKTKLSLVDSDEIKLPSVEELSPDQRGRIALHAKELTTLIEAVEKKVKEDALNGIDYPHVKVIQGDKGKRNLIKDIEAVSEGMKALGVKEPTVPKLRPLSYYEKIVGKDALEPFITRSKPSLRIVPIDDKRPKVESAKALLGEFKEENKND